MDLKYKHRTIILFFSASLIAHFFQPSASENSKLCVPCKPGWYHFGEKCYKILGLNKPLNWENSREKCSLEGGHLASIHSIELQEFLTTFLILTSQSDVWIGLHDRIKESRFYWDDGSNFNYTNWDAHRPFSTHRGLDSVFDCVEMRYFGHMKSRGVGTWADQQCDSRPRPYLCQVNKSVDTNSPDPRFCSSEDGGGFKYFGSCYHIVEEEKSWEDAESYCEEKFEGNLVTILDWKSEMFINHIHKLYLPKDIWIGIKLKNNEERRTKKWATGRVVTYSNWSKEPLHFGNGSCALKSYRNSWDSWEFSPCFNNFSFICEKKIAPLPRRTPSDDWKCPNSSEKNSSEKNLSKKGLDLEGDPCFYTETEKSQNLLEESDECRRIGFLHNVSVGTVVGIVFCTLLTVLLVGVIVHYSRKFWMRSYIKSENDGFSCTAPGFNHHASKEVIWRPLR